MSRSTMKDDKKMKNDPPLRLDLDDMEDLRNSYFILEHPSLAARLSSVIGTPIEVALHLLPTSWYRRIHAISEKALTKTLKTAVSSMRRDQEVTAHEIYYKALVAGSGGIGGFFGLPGLVLELPVTTTLMLRGVAEIAREEGEDTREAETQLACVQVFALGGKTEVDDAAETGYYGVRLALSAYMTAAYAEVATHGFSAGSGPAVIRVINMISSRFGVMVTQRMATQLMPVISAVSAAGVNTIFMQHFQHMARAHFTIRRLERKYSKEFIRAQYRMLEEEDQLSRSSR